jgi:hypothetical protein
LAVVAVLAVYTAWCGGGGWARRWQQVLTFTAVGLTLSLPWMARNLLHTGDPLFPLISRWHVFQKLPAFDEAATADLLPAFLPTLAGTWWPSDWQTAINPLLLVGIGWWPLARAGPRQEAGRWTALLLLVVDHQVGLIGRYALPAWAWCAAFAPSGVALPTALRPWARRGSFALVALLAVMSSAFLAPRLPLLLGQVTTDQYLRQHTPLVAAYDWLVNCPEPGPILLVDPRGFRCPRDYLAVYPRAVPYCLTQLPDMPPAQQQSLLLKTGARLLMWNFHNPTEAESVMEWEVRDLPPTACSLHDLSEKGLLRDMPVPILASALTGRGCRLEGGTVWLSDQATGLRDGHPIRAALRGLAALGGPVLYAEDGVVIQRLRVP